MKKAKVKYKYEAEKIPYILAKHYVPDFIVITKSGKIYIEAKGYFRPEARTKMVAVKIANPSLDIRIVFYSKNKSYIKWAERHGFPYAIGEIPQEWLNE